MSDAEKSYAELKALLAEVQAELQRPDLTPEQRNELQVHAASLAGALSSPWLPMGWTRKLLMLAIAGVGLEQAAVGNYWALWLWALLPVFSPRIVGEMAAFAGSFARGFRGGPN